MRKQPVVLRWLLRAGAWTAAGLAVFYLPTDPTRAAVCVGLAFVLLLDSRLPLPPDDMD